MTLPARFVEENKTQLTFEILFP